MESKFKKTMVIVVLSVLAFTCYAEDEPEPNKPAIDKKVDLSSDSSKVELTTELVPEGDNSAGQIEANLAKEYYKDCVQNLKWALGIIVVLVAGFIGYAIFKSKREYRETLADVKEALRDAREACREARGASDKAREYEDKAKERLSSIDNEVTSKLKEIEEKAKVLITELIQEAENQREVSRQEAEKERKVTELLTKGWAAAERKDYALATDYYNRVIKIEPRNDIALNNLGASLMDQAKINSGDERKRLLGESIDKLQEAYSLEPWPSAYNLGLAHALLDNELECKKWLKKAEEQNVLPDRNEAMEDLDLESVRDKEWFKQLRWADDAK